MDKRLLSLTSDDIVRILRAEGFVLSRTKGSHLQYVGLIKGQKRRVTVMAKQRRFTPKTLKSMIEQSGLNAEEWLELKERI